MQIKPIRILSAFLSAIWDKATKLQQALQSSSVYMQTFIGMVSHTI